MYEKIFDWKGSLVPKSTFKKEAILTYLGRILVPVWNEFITFFEEANKVDSQIINFTSSHIDVICTKLK